MIDVTHQINAVRRRVGSRTLEAGEARVVTIGQNYDTDADDLWDACTNIERIPRWFLPITGDLEVGGRYQLDGNAHGTILTCDPPREFTATWEFGDGVSWIELRITGEGPHRSRFELAHISHVDDHWEQFGPGAVGIGWDMILLGLGLHVETGVSMTPEAAAQWTTSPEGVAFMTATSEHWQQVSVAAGTDPEEAAAAASRCLAAYKGEVVDPGADG